MNRLRHMYSEHPRALLTCGIAVVLGLVALGYVAVRGQDIDREDPAATAEAVTAAWVTNGEDVCALATPQWADELATQDRCTSTGSNQPAEDVRVLFAKPCATRALAGVASADGSLGAPYALLGMERDEQGQWAVDSLTPLSDRQAVQPGRCETEEAG